MHGSPPFDHRGDVADPIVPGLADALVGPSEERGAVVGGPVGSFPAGFGLKALLLSEGAGSGWHKRGKSVWNEEGRRSRIWRRTTRWHS